MESTNIAGNCSSVHEATGLISGDAVTIKSINRGNKNNPFDLRRIVTALPYLTAAIGIGLVLVLVRVSVHQGMLSNGLFPLNNIVNQGTSGGLKASVNQPSDENDVIQLTFPPDVFDISKADNEQYISELTGRCNTAIDKDSSNPRHVLACKIYFDSNSVVPTMALGTLKLGTDILTMMKEGKYDSGDINQIFVPKALAVMINEGCFQFAFDANSIENKSYQYDSSSSYASTITDGGSIDIKASVGYGPVTLSAGYSNEKSSFTDHQENYSFTFGTKSVRKSLGVLENVCLNKDRFNIFKDNDLIQQHVVDNWNDITNNSWSSNSNSINGAEKETFDGGLLMPNSYSYGLYAKYDIRMSSMGTSQENRNSNKEAISAGLNVGFGAASASGSVRSIVSNAVKEKSTSSTSTVDVHVRIVGSNDATQDCFLYSDDRSCGALFDSEIDSLRNDIDLLVGGPVNHKTFVSIEDLSKWYNEASSGTGGVDEQGFPDDFYTCAEKYISGCDEYYGGSCTKSDDYDSDLDFTEISFVCCPPYKMLGTRSPTLAPHPTPSPTPERSAHDCQLYCFNCFHESGQPHYRYQECIAGCNDDTSCMQSGAWNAGNDYKHIWAFNPNPNDNRICQCKY